MPATATPPQRDPRRPGPHRVKGGLQVTLPQG